jgi:hypothetical protein
MRQQTMITNKYLHVATSFLLLALVGCSTTYVPAPGTPDLKEIPDFHAGLKIALLNAQTNTEQIVLSSHKQNTYYANLHDWTDRLNQSLKDTLRKKRVEVTEVAAKSLKLSIEAAAINMKAGGLNPRCTLNWKVELGDGTVIPMTVETGHWKIEDASNVAVRLACRDTLRNERVRTYMGGP